MNNDIRSACPHDCPDTCAMLTRVEDNVVVSVRGDPAHPFTRGALCAKVRNYEQRVYHPDRILYPLRRVGAKGSGEFERISWDTALDEIGSRVQSIISADGPEAVLPCSYLGQQGLLNGLYCGDKFFNKLGASVGERTFCNAGATLAYNMTLGSTLGLDPESFALAKVIIIWGCNVIGSMPHHWPFIRQAQKNGATLVVIDPLRTRTAAHADRHVRPRPGTDLALAFGLMHVIIAEGLMDTEYAQAHIHGLDALQTDVEAYTPAAVEALTGVAAEEIVALARLYASTQPSAIRVGVAIERHANGPDSVRAISLLPALTGAWKHVGGGIFQNSGRAFPMNRDAMAMPELIPPKTRVVNLLGLGRALTTLSDPPINALFVYNCNPVIAAPEQERTIEGLSREDLFTVVSEQFMSDTARYADLVLPATTQLEQLDLMYAWGHVYLSINQPAIAPLGEAVSNTELFRRLSARMGFNDHAFMRTDEELMEVALDWSHPSLEGITIDLLKQRGWMRLAVGAADERLPHADGNFPTTTGKCEYVSTDAARGSEVLTTFRQCYAGEQEAAPLNAAPLYRPTRARKPNEFSLVSPKTHYFLNSSYANFAGHSKRNGVQPIWLHPSDAETYGIEAGDTVQVKNATGALRASALVTEDTLPGVAVVPHGYWRGMQGANQASVNALNPHAPALLGKAPTFSDTLVTIEKI